MKFAALILLLLAACQVTASSDLPAPVVDALRKTLPHHEPNKKYIEMGDLNNDGVAEIATLLGDPDYNKFKEKDGEIRIVILSGNPSEGFKVLTSSPELPRDPNVFYFLRVKNKSLYLLTSGRGFTLNYQFKLRGGDFVLIGEESTSFSPSEENAPYIKESFNYLTGRAVHSEKSSKGYKEKKGSFEGKRLVKLVEFNLSDEFFHTQPSQVEYAP